MKITIIINNIKIKTFSHFTILQICENLNIFIPRFCYHSKLSIAGNCRMCLIEVKNSIKPVVACSTPIINNMEIFTNTPLVKKSRENILEFLLINHPLDCPICDQGGECDLQDQTLFYGLDLTRFTFFKRGVQNKNLGPFIKTIMTRCIHCTRCVRFLQEIGGLSELGTIGRGTTTEISTFLNKSILSNLSGNITDICPVGALTIKPSAFKARSWEIEKKITKDCLNSLHSSIRVDILNNKILKILPNTNILQLPWISDKTRFSFDGLFSQRLKKPLLKLKNNQFQEISWEKSFEIIQYKLKITDSSQILGLIDNFIDFESSYFLKYFFNLNGIKNLYSVNSLSKNIDFLNYSFNLQKFKKTDLCLLLFCDLNHENVLLNVQLKNQYAKNIFPIYTIGNKINLTYPSIHLGNSLNHIIQIIEGKSIICTKIKKALHPLIIIGSNFFKVKNADNILMFLQKYFSVNIMFYNISSYNFIHNNINYKKTISSNIKLLFLYNVQKPINQIESDSFKIYQGTHYNLNAQLSDLILPTANYFEKNGYYINIFNKINKTSKILTSKVPSDFLILQMLLLYFNFKFYKKNYILNKIYFLIPMENKNIKNLKLINCKNFLIYKQPIQIYIKNYYLDNNITQNSKLMALRTKTLLPFLNNFKLC